MNYDNLRIKKELKKYNIGEIVTYKTFDDKKIKGLFIEYVDDSKLKLILIDNKLYQGVEVIINNSQII